MAMFGGSFTDMLKEIMSHVGKDNDVSMEKRPETNSGNDPMVIHPNQAATNKQLADVEMNPFAGMGLPINLNQAPEGTARNFLSRILSPEREKNQGGVESMGTARSEELLSTPSKEQPQANLAPTSIPNYSLPTIDPKSIQEFRNSLYKDAGQGAAPLATAGQDPNSLGGRMNSPYYEVDKRNQMREGQDISDRFSLTRKNKAGVNPFKMAGDYIGDRDFDPNGPPELGIAIGKRDEKGNVIRNKDPAAIMRDRPDDEEGYTNKENPFLWIRKKKPGRGNEGPLTS